MTTPVHCPTCSEERGVAIPASCPHLPDHIEEHYSTDDYKTDTEAIRARNARARQLRKQGYTVTCRHWDFTDLARCRDYTLTARRD